MRTTMRPFGKFEIRALDSLVPYARNARTHSAAQVAQLRASIREFGFTNPLLVDEAGGIIAGHGRLEAARAEGMAEVPCIVLAGLTEAHKRALVLADNKLALNAGWDDELLRVELLELRDGGFDVDLTGFSADEVDALLNPTVADGLTDPDDAPPLPAEPVAKPGDLWLLGPHRVLCGEATSTTDLDRLLGGELVDAVWTDPLYNVAYEGRAGSIANDDLSAGDFAELLRAAFTGAFAAMKPGAAIYVAHADTEGWAFRDAFRRAGLKLAGVLVWRKNALVLGRSDYQWIHEPILYGWKPGSRHRWFGGRKQTTVADLDRQSPFTEQPDGTWAVQVGGRVLVVDGAARVQELEPSILEVAKPRKNAQHPTMKPVELIERHLGNSARPRDLVLDLFGGSGSTLMAAERLGMCARLLELDPRFVDVIVQRWEAYTGRKAELQRVEVAA